MPHYQLVLVRLEVICFIVLHLLNNEAHVNDCLQLPHIFIFPIVFTWSKIDYKNRKIPNFISDI